MGWNMQIEKIRRRLKMRDLDTLVAVVRAGGMRKAADALAMSQPAVSKAIAELEDALGLHLLERSRRGVVPTAFGDALVRRSERLIDEVRGMLREIEELADPEGGEVRLGSMETLLAGVVGATVHDMMARHPRLRLTLESALAGDLMSHFLMRREVDFVVARPHPGPLPPEIAAEPLFHDRLLVVTDHAHPLARRRKLSAADLHDALWVLSRYELRPDSPVAHWFAGQGLSLPPRVASSGSLQLRFHLLEQARAITCIPHSLLPFLTGTPRLRVLPVRIPAWPTATMIMTLRERLLPPAAHLFVARLRERSRPLASEPDL